MTFFGKMMALLVVIMPNLAVAPTVLHPTSQSYIPDPLDAYNETFAVTQPATTNPSKFAAAPPVSPLDNKFTLRALVGSNVDVLQCMVAPTISGRFTDPNGVAINTEGIVLQVRGQLTNGSAYNMDVYLNASGQPYRIVAVEPTQPEDIKLYPPEIIDGMH